MAYTRDQAFETHKDYKENVNQWEYVSVDTKVGTVEINHTN